MEISREQSLKFITSKSNITAPGVYRVKVTNVHPYTQMLSNGVQQVAIANFNAKTAYHEQVAATLFAQGDYAQAANQGLSAKVLEGQFYPMKGQMVDIVVEEITTKNGITGLFVQAMSAAPIETPKKSSEEAFLSLLNATNSSVSVLDEESSEIPFETKQQVNG